MSVVIMNDHFVQALITNNVSLKRIFGDFGLIGNDSLREIDNAFYQHALPQVEDHEVIHVNYSNPDGMWLGIYALDPFSTRKHIPAPVLGRKLAKGAF